MSSRSGQPKRASSCIHVIHVGSNSWEDIYRKKAGQESCENCHAYGPNLWLCLHSQCLYVGCGESALDHSSTHAKERSGHCLTLNLTTMRIWCYQCEAEVYRDNNTPSFVMRERALGPVSGTGNEMKSSPTSSVSAGGVSDESDSDDEDENERPRGLTGLQNIGNTCYLNAAIQSLSNCPPLTRYFLDCGGCVRTDKKPMLCKNYLRLMQEMWHKKRPSYVVPSGVVHGIKQVHPMFRGFAQQDSQEFLRCFMDQIHEELKQPVVREDLDEDDQNYSSNMVTSCEPEASIMSTKDEYTTTTTTTTATTATTTATTTDTATQIALEPHSQSDTDYETCDSGMSSEKSSIELNTITDDVRDSHSTRKTSNGEVAGKPLQSSRSEPLPAGEQSPSKQQHKPDKNHPNSPSLTAKSQVSSSQSISNIDNSNISNAKCVKDSANLAKISNVNTYASQGDPGAGQGHPGSTEVDSGEYSDAMSELEPLNERPDGIRRRTTSGDSERREPKQQQQQQQCTIASPNAGQMKAQRKKRSTEHQSIISDIFDGRILSSVQCLTCERISSTNETFQDLSLPIPSKDHIHMLHAQQIQQVHKGTCAEVTLNQGWLSWMFGWMRSWFLGPTINLQDCLAAFFSADELKGDNMYSCEKCKKLRNGMKYSKVLKLPEILCIHLKRFRHEFMFSSKIGTYVSFPMDNLDMGPYLHKDCKDKITQYDLIAVICHHGTAGGGHYTSYGLNYVNNQWFEYDDQCVTEVDLQQVENAEAYVLFYRKKKKVPTATLR